MVAPRKSTGMIRQRIEPLTVLLTVLAATLVVSSRQCLLMSYPHNLQAPCRHNPDSLYRKSLRMRRSRQLFRKTSTRAASNSRRRPAAILVHHGVRSAALVFQDAHHEFLPAKLNPFEFFSFVTLFPTARHVAGHSTASMAKVCVKRPVFAFQEFPSNCTDRRRWRKNHIQHISHGRRSKGGRYPQNPTKFRRFFRFDGFLFAQGITPRVRLRHISARLLTRFRFVAFYFYFVHHPLSQTDR